MLGCLSPFGRVAAVRAGILRNRQPLFGACALPRGFMRTLKTIQRSERLSSSFQSVCQSVLQALALPFLDESLLPEPPLSPVSGPFSLVPHLIDLWILNSALASLIAP